MASSISLLQAARRTSLQVEQLEARRLLSGYQPTVAEQVFLERLNDARANPAAYGASIGLDLSQAAPAQPLAFHPLLIQAARQHAWDMNSRGYFSHFTPEGISAGDRIRGTGFSALSWAESLIVGTPYTTPEEALRGLILDEGVPDLGHRRHLLALDGTYRNDNLIGVGIVLNGSGPHRNYYASDTAAGADPRAYLTGVVYRDQNSNGRYDAGEGLGGVTLSVNGVPTLYTYQTGGYSLPLAPGTYTITVQGDSLPAPVIRSVTIGSTNVRLNLSPGAETKDEAFIRRLYLKALGRPAGAAEVAHWVGVLQQNSRRDAVVNAIERSAEARTRLVRAWYVTHLGRQAGNGEEQNWVQALVNGATEEQVLTSILSSAEFFNRASALHDLPSAEGDFVQALYQQLLGRTANLEEVNAWLPHVASLGRHGIVNIFVNSGEYRGRLLYQYYVDILGRLSWPSQAEVTAWAYSGIDLATVRVLFKSSGEFYG